MKLNTKFGTSVRLLTRLTAFLLCSTAFLSRGALDMVGISVINNGGGATMASNDWAGAPGWRTTNWNNFQGINNSTNTLSTVKNQYGVATGISATFFTPGSYSTRPGSTSNDTKMFATVLDPLPNVPNKVSVSGIPYAKYNVAFYIWNGSGNGSNVTAGGYFAITNSANTNILMRYISSQDSTFTQIPLVDGNGNGYVQSTTAFIPPLGPWTNVQGGNYVVFSGLTNSDFTCILAPIGGNAATKDFFGNSITNGTTTQRMKFSGFQIQQMSTTTLTNLQLTGLPILLAGNPSSSPAGLLWGLYSDGSSNTIPLLNATLSSSDSNIFTVSTSGQIQPYHAGTAGLIVSNQSLTITQAVTVLAPTQVWPTLAKSNLFVSVNGASGDTAQAQVFANFAGSNNVNVTAFNYISFSSVSPAVVNVTANGSITAVGPGAFNLNVTFAGVNGSANNAGVVTTYTPPASGVPALSLKLTDSSHPMSIHDFSGAPGARVSYWNNMALSGQNVTNQLASPVDSQGNTLANVSVTFAGASTSNPGVATVGTPTTNESAMFNTFYNSGVTLGTDPTCTTKNQRSIVISNIPYSSYDAYFYVYNDASHLDYAGSFYINGVEKMLKNFTTGASTPNSDGSGYVLAVQPTSLPTLMSQVPAGHYVVFTGLTDPTLTVKYGPAGHDEIGDSAAGIAHLDLAGFQIVKSISGLTPTNIYTSTIPGVPPGQTYQVVVLADFSDGTTGGNITAWPGVSFTSADPTIFTVDGSGLITPVKIGYANLIVSYQSLSSTQLVVCLPPQSQVLFNATFENGLLPSTTTTFANYANPLSAPNNNSARCMMPTTAGTSSALLTGATACSGKNLQLSMQVDTATAGSSYTFRGNLCCSSANGFAVTGYGFSMDGTGHFLITRYDNMASLTTGVPTNLVAVINATVVTTGWNNILFTWTTNGVLSLSINGTIVATTTDTTYAPGVVASDGVGLWAWGGANLAIDNIQVSTVEVGSTAPASLISVLSGGVAQFSWPADHLGWRLQKQTSTLNQGIGTNWVDVPGSVSVTSMNIPVNPSDGAVFYRMVFP